MPDYAMLLFGVDLGISSYQTVVGRKWQKSALFSPTFLPSANSAFISSLGLVLFRWYLQRNVRKASILLKTVCSTLQSFREINLDIKQEVILSVTESDLREVTAPRYFEAEVLGEQFSHTSKVRMTCRVCEATNYLVCPQMFWFKQSELGTENLHFYKFPKDSDAVDSGP